MDFIIMACVLSRVPSQLWLNSRILTSTALLFDSWRKFQVAQGGAAICLIGWIFCSKASHRRGLPQISHYHMEFLASKPWKEWSDNVSFHHYHHHPWLEPDVEVIEVQVGTHANSSGTAYHYQMMMREEYFWCWQCGHIGSTFEWFLKFASMT